MQTVNPADVSIFDARVYAAPIMQQRQMQMQNALAQAMMPKVRDALRDGVQYNALAQHGGPTKAAAGVMDQYDASGSGNALAQGIIETANALQMDPVDLATIISYETAGTFDPTKRGPTTQWGQHRGLIQFGEPQARQYGVDWNDPLGSQLGADGAIARYYRQNGWRPGMGMLDAYSIVNAGGPGLYNRSDANNGGAPGTVRDKVEQQMSGHRRKAEALLGPFASAGNSQATMREAFLADLGL